MLPIDLDVTRSVRAYMASCMNGPEFSLERVHGGLCDAVWYSPKDRRALRALCDQHPQEFTRWLYERERDGRYTGLIMVWPAGYSTPIHDHAGLWGIEMVLQGTLGVEDYELTTDERGEAQPRFVGTTLLEEGQSCAFRGTAGHAHRCTNLSARRAAVTLHVYGGLLETYCNFDPALGGRYVAAPTIARIDGSLGATRVRSA
ncbi:cysteine dioxygenase family protein [Dokdonella soli]|uniref:Cysteine dioxygenase n=1 Tax=Dokdonella soli TaxID=529810 RepID=A0ABN1IDY8_9GAMM